MLPSFSGGYVCKWGRVMVDGDRTDNHRVEWLKVTYTTSQNSSRRPCHHLIFRVSPLWGQMLHADACYRWYKRPCSKRAAIFISNQFFFFCCCWKYKILTFWLRRSAARHEAPQKTPRPVNNARIQAAWLLQKVEILYFARAALRSGAHDTCSERGSRHHSDLLHKAVFKCSVENSFYFPFSLSFTHRSDTRHSAHDWKIFFFFK